jgi:hypothetical protein
MHVRSLGEPNSRFPNGQQNGQYGLYLAHAIALFYHLLQKWACGF